MRERQYVDIRLTPELLEAITIAASYIRAECNNEVPEVTDELCAGAVTTMKAIPSAVWEAFMRESNELSLALGRVVKIGVRHRDGSFTLSQYAAPDDLR